MFPENTDEVIGVTNCNTHVTESFDSTTPILSSHDSNSSGDSKGIGPGNSSKAEVSTSSIPQERSKSRLPISILPEDPEEKRNISLGWY
jgi:hypothetical protein